MTVLATLPPGRPDELETALSFIRKDWSRLERRIRTLEHDVSTSCARLTLRLHYPAFRDAEATVSELAYAVRHFIPYFCLPRKVIEDLYAKRERLSDFDYHVEVTALNERARELFMRAQAATGRSGEAGELLLYLLTEWLLDAPQLVAKMSLKTNRDMPVHGSDGIHVKYDPATRRLVVYSGEAKLHREVGAAVRSAVASISEALGPDKLNHELALVRRDLDLSGLPSDAHEALLAYLDPWDERSNQRVDAVTCLLGFDFAGYAGLGGMADAEAVFGRLATDQLRSTSAAFERALKRAGLGDRTVELFLMPLPSVDRFRALFLEGVGRPG